MSASEILQLVIYGTVMLGFCAFGIERFILLFLYLRNRRNRPEPKQQFDELPSVTVQLPIYNERYVAKRLIDAVAEFDYPRDRLQIQVLDDSTDDTVEISAAAVKELKAQDFEIEHLHREDRTGFKAGALEAGMATATGEFLLILDADFVPQPMLLSELVHYFTDPKVAMVQARWGHLNRDANLLTRLQSILLDGHLVIQQTARSRSGAFFNFNGTAGIWRRTAIDEVGGWEHDTITEDLDLSYRAQMAGWRFVFLEDVEVPAELPIDINGFKSQQHRWTKGSIQCCRKLLRRIWASEAPLWVKAEATGHLTANYAYILLIGLVFVGYPAALIERAGAARVVLIDAPVFLLATASVAVFYLASQIAQPSRRPFWLQSVLLLPGVMALGIGMAINNVRAVIEALVGHESPFVRTPKYGEHSDDETWQPTRKGYRSGKSWTVVGEFGIALFLLIRAAYAIRAEQYGLVVFLLIFGLGFAYVAVSSIQPRLSRRRKANNLR